jgi:nicotinamidase-related amidase
MDNKALLVVDIQEVLFKDPQRQPYNAQKMIESVKQLIAAARAAGTEVIYVRHDGGKGSIAEAGTDGWQIYHEIPPADGERIFDKKYCSSFLKTGLKEYLDGKKIDTLILTGMQTEYCIDTTCRCAFEYGYKVIIPEGTNTTYDNDYLSGEKLYRFFNYSIWNDCFADVVPLEEVLNAIEKQ